MVEPVAYCVALADVFMVHIIMKGKKLRVQKGCAIHFF